MRRLIVPAVSALLLAAPAAGFAAPARGAAAAPTVLKLSETATVMVRPDELAASLRAETVAASAAEAQAGVNATIEAALVRAKAVAGVSVSTGGYGVYRIDRDLEEAKGAGKAERWQAGQSLELSGGDGAALLKLVGELQQSGLAVRDLGWRLAAETARKAHAEATRLALAGLRARSDEAASVIGMVFGGFKEIRLDGDRPAPFAPRLMSAAKAVGRAAPPSAEAGDFSVSATAEAEMWLRSR